MRLPLRNVLLQLLARCPCATDVERDAGGGDAAVLKSTVSRARPSKLPVVSGGEVHDDV